MSGNVRRRIGGWRQAGADLQVLQWLQHGVKINFTNGPPPKYDMGSSCTDLTVEEQKFLDYEIDRQLTSGAWIETDNDGWVSRAFLAPKPGYLPNGVKKFRLVIDLRPVNKYCGDFDLRFETLKTLQYLARPNDWAIAFDLADGYHAVSVHPEHRKYMTFRLNGKLYSASALPFGWNGSPATFCRIMRVLTRLLRAPDVPARAPRGPE